MSSRKKEYKRSTPVVRLQRNVLKLERYGELVLNRLSSWIADGDTSLVACLEDTANIMQDIASLKVSVDKLEAHGFVPPKRSFKLVFDPGQVVSIAPKHRERYALAFAKVIKDNPSYLDELSVVEILPTREILVRHGKNSPFMVRKSHLVAVG